MIGFELIGAGAVEENREPFVKGEEAVRVAEFVQRIYGCAKFS